ncbi:MAG: ABC transporter ATP-binding protein [Spirochaetia bacterium]|nr:ABC transporter ATP-binding protein [Spirochaetia bacterium]
MNAIEMKSITKRFGSLIANNNIDFTLKKGSIHALLGENGAGKTTLMNQLFGLSVADEGSILIEGEPINLEHSPQESMQRGIGMVHQHFMLIKNMSVISNIMLANEDENFPLLNPKLTKKKIIKLSEKYHLNVNPNAIIENLSVGQQQRVEILAALYKETNTLILDEPTAVLTPEEVDDLFIILRELKESGKSIVIITHHLNEIMDIADEVTVLRNGNLIGTYLINEKTSTQELSRLMVGRDVLFDFKKQNEPKVEKILEVKNLIYSSNSVKQVNDISFYIKKGEIFAIAGVDGNGQKELCDTIVGLNKMDSGKIYLKNYDISNTKVKYRIKNGISYIPQDRQKSGLVMNWSISDNLILKTYERKPIANGIFVSNIKAQEQASRMIDKYNIKSQNSSDKANQLSGGNQQKVILAREMDRGPALLIASHPTRGLDVGAMEYVRNQMLELRNNGGSVLLVSADLEEIFQIADRIAVIFKGQFMGILKPDCGIAKLGRLMAGLNEGERSE